MITVGRQRGQLQRLLKMLLGCRALVVRVFCNREINQENRIGRRELLGPTEITERVSEITVVHQRDAIGHQTASVVRALYNDVVPERFLGFPNLVPLKSRVAVRARNSATAHVAAIFVQCGSRSKRATSNAAAPAIAITSPL